MNDDRKSKQTHERNGKGKDFVGDQADHGKRGEKYSCIDTFLSWEHVKKQQLS